MISWAQPILNAQEPEVKVLARVVEGKAIKLRWGVTTPLAWKYANDYGFVIKRKTIVKNGAIVKASEFKVLTAQPILPKPLTDWEQFTATSANAAVAAQALFGEGFQVDMEDGGNGILSIVNQSKALEQRFSFAMSAADQEYRVAEFSGLAYTDTTVVPGEQYLYRIYTAIPETRLNVKYGGVFTGLQDFQPLPTPLDFVGVFNDHSVMLSWNYTLQKQIYNNFIIERSEDNGNNFIALQDIAIANFSERDKKPSDRMFYVDSLPQNNYEYQYRIKGVSPFGEIGPASNTIKGTGRQALTSNPAITSAVLSQEGGQVELFWEFPEEGLSTIHHFKIQKSNTVKGTYVTVMDAIDKNKRSIVLRNLDGINYFKVTAVGFQGEERISFPKMVQLSDSTPPEVPQALTGTVDSTGVVRLQWKNNVEADFLGYRVFRANLEQEEFTQITFEPIVAPVFIDTIKIANLNRKVYYKVKAYDKRYNPSEFSEVLELKKPDVVPPTQPLVRLYNAGDNGILLEWITSSSQDAVQTIIYRKEQGTKDMWQLVARVDIPTAEFLDTTAAPDKTYLYTLITIDTSGLESPPIRPVAITAAKLKAQPIERFVAVVNAEARFITLRWHTKQTIEEYTLFKAETGKPLSSFKTVEGDIKQLKDVQLQINTSYTYGIQGLLPNGLKTPLKKIEIEY